MTGLGSAMTGLGSAMTNGSGLGDGQDKAGDSERSVGGQNAANVGGQNAANEFRWRTGRNEWGTKGCACTLWLETISGESLPGVCRGTLPGVCRGTLPGVCRGTLPG
eukprot:4980174-Pleurochrysis_carterae.AAC.1